METLQAIFPASDFTLLVAIVALPLIGAFVNGVFGKRLGNEAVKLMALCSVGAAFVGSVVTFVMLRAAQTGEEAARFVWHGWQWLSLSAAGEASQIHSGAAPAHISVEIGFSVDALNGTMALIVTGVGFLIHLYSTKYMEEDPGFHRFFCYLNLFIFAMLVLIFGNSLPVLFIGWEGVGLCSYLLIGFWFDGAANAGAGKKAFIVNRVGDFGLLVAMALLIRYTGALDWAGIEDGAQGLLAEQKIWELPPWIASHIPDSLHWIAGPHSASVATLTGLCLFLGCAGKSAQLPLYVWLPDAMAGPTPVSALIHAATMVTAGVYLVCRLSPVFVLSPTAMFVVALVGALTAVFAATIAFVQNDIKKVLAYSTVSQLGYMFLGAGVGAFTAGFFHVITHAFFKACLFLGAGSVIHAMHARIHDTDASQDVRNMGGLFKYMPTTAWTFLASCACIVGLPLTSGFFSKDEILFKAYTSSVGGEGDWPSWGPKVLFGLGVAGAVMTAFYMSRLFILTFMGDFKGWKVVSKWKPSEDDHHHDHHAHDDHHAESAAEREGPIPHESPWQMTLPLVVLSGLALLGGWLNAHALFHSHRLDDFLDPVFATAAKSIVIREDAEHLETALLVPGLLAFLIGVGLAFWVYLNRRGEPAKELAEKFPGLYRLVYDKWRVDELYDEFVTGTLDTLAELCVWVDRWVVDNLIARLTSWLVAVVGYLLRLLQTGHVQAYAAMTVLGVAGVGWFMVSPHAEAEVSPAGAGVYVVQAEAGLGYQYRWDADGDGKFDSEDFGNTREIRVTPPSGEQRKVGLEVRNAFGRVAHRSFEVGQSTSSDAEPSAALERHQGQVADVLAAALPVMENK